MRAPDQPRLRLSADSQGGTRDVPAEGRPPRWPRLSCPAPSLDTSCSGRRIPASRPLCVEAMDRPSSARPPHPTPLEPPHSCGPGSLQPGLGRRSPSTPGSSCSGLGQTVCLCPRSTGQREHRKTPRDRECLLGSGCGLSWLVCHTRAARCPAHILWLLRTRSSASIPGTPVETHCHSLNKSFWASTMYDALRSRDACNEDLALLV